MNNLKNILLLLGVGMIICGTIVTLAIMQSVIGNPDAVRIWSYTAGIPMFGGVICLFGSILCLPPNPVS